MQHAVTRQLNASRVCQVLSAQNTIEEGDGLHTQGITVFAYRQDSFEMVFSKQPSN